MINRVPATDTLTFRLSNIVQKLMDENPCFREQLDRQKIMEMLLNVFESVDRDSILLLEEEELLRRVDLLMATELVYGMLDTLTPEEMAQFDAAVAGR
ncbi:hypothetical protein PJF56_05505 [Roseofilum sp. BLCC_M91]|uniref:Uncharacterized protein n=1 Tax=Roseofilum halophilum BLCC-M91 TaxID=3022259 RepID=A0ABT7BIJ4_9CYAN|nr:hypothetical protein [Roseofilum halophilum]MDJ1178311.1 hypothetical protein [Roseofilum halophilum BLCC-M91]